jgi:GNAT superfamily N-acetyltransferase
MLEIREASSKDTALILSFIRELAEYEREPHAVVATEKDLKRDGFTSDPKFHALIAEWDSEPAGMAFYFYNYSTWQGRRGVYLEDIFVRPAFRGKGVGRELMAYLARIAVAQNCFGIRWEVLDWNETAVEFYKGLGARFREHWQSMQIQGDELQRLANSHDGESTTRR